MKTFLTALLAFAALAGPAVAQAPDTTVADADTGYVEYNDSPLSLPLGIGLRVPTYNRVDGLALPWGPRYELPDERLRADALVTYRSHLGDFDPSLEVRFRPSEGQDLNLFAARSTFSNDDWIRADLANTMDAFAVGSDARNYFRADRVEAKYRPTLRMGTIEVTPLLGGRFESDWGTGSLTPRSTPWSFLGRTDSLKMRRPNPPIIKGHIASALLGAGLAIDEAGLTGKITATLERAFTAPRGPVCSTPYEAPSPACAGRSAERFGQTTVDATVTFPTFGTQVFSATGHALLASGGLLPPERYGYLGGGSTLSTVNLLALGGDRLVFVRGDYMVPIPIINLKYLGSPYVDLRYAAGAAGVGALPSFIQNVGVAAGISYFQASYMIDPASNRSPKSRRSDFSIGLSLNR